MSQSVSQNVTGGITTESVHYQLKRLTYVVYFNPIEKHIDSDFFFSIYKILTILVNVFAVLFNSIEKYADSQKHALENMPLCFLFYFILFWRERESEICIRIRDLWSISGNIVNPLLLRVFFKFIFIYYLFFYFEIFSVLKQYIFLRCLMRDLFYCFLVCAFVAYFSSI